MHLRWMNCLRRKADRKGSSFKVFSRGADRTSLASYIRLFEPMVIKALKVISSTICLRWHTASHCIIQILFSESIVILNLVVQFMWVFLKMVCQEKYHTVLDLPIKVKRFLWKTVWVLYEVKCWWKIDHAHYTSLVQHTVVCIMFSWLQGYPEFHMICSNDKGTFLMNCVRFSVCCLLSLQTWQN